jgi:hypothetical protein
MAVVISDFFTTDEAARQLLRQLQGQNQEVVVFHARSGRIGPAA